MSMLLLIHILAGSLGLVSGFVALYAAKGATLHRRAGMVFVAVMLTMSLSGMVMAAVTGVWAEVNISAAILTAYLVVTGLTTVRPPATGSRWLSLVAMLVALAVGVICLVFGLEAIARGGQRNGIPAFPFLLFGVLGLLASAGDLRMSWSEPLRGATRVTRHLWRMSSALLIAAMSFFLGQSDEFPKALRIMPLLATPVLVVLVTMLYWVWRIRVRRSLRGIASARAAEAV